MMNINKMRTLMYLLIRDSIPSGELIKLVEMAKIDEEIIFSNPHILALADDLLKRLK